MVVVGSWTALDWKFGFYIIASSGECLNSFPCRCLVAGFLDVVAVDGIGIGFIVQPKIYIAYLQHNRYPMLLTPMDCVFRTKGGMNERLSW